MRNGFHAAVLRCRMAGFVVYFAIQTSQQKVYMATVPDPSAVLGQGVVLMLAGMGIVFFFLALLVATTGLSMKFFAKFNGILGEDAPKKAPRLAAAADDDANMALAIAVALNR